MIENKGEMKRVTVRLPANVACRLRADVDNGKYLSVSEAVRFALCLMYDRDSCDSNSASIFDVKSYTKK